MNCASPIERTLLKIPGGRLPSRREIRSSGSLLIPGHVCFSVRVDFWMTRLVAVRKGNVAHDGPLTEDAVRAKYPGSKYRVSRFRYPPRKETERTDATSDLPCRERGWPVRI